MHEWTNLKQNGFVFKLARNNNKCESLLQPLAAWDEYASLKLLQKIIFSYEGKSINKLTCCRACNSHAKCHSFQRISANEIPFSDFQSHLLQILKICGLFAIQIIWSIFYNFILDLFICFFSLLIIFLFIHSFLRICAAEQQRKKKEKL